MMKRMCYLLLGVVPICSLTPVMAEDLTPARVEFFESKIRPVLVKHCYKCHSKDAKNIKGGLLLDTRAGIRAGGDSGEAVIPKNVDDSLLISSLKYEDYEMPPKGKLPANVIEANVIQERAYSSPVWLRPKSLPQIGDAPPIMEGE